MQFLKNRKLLLVKWLAILIGIVGLTSGIVCGMFGFTALLLSDSNWFLLTGSLVADGIGFIIVSIPCLWISERILFNKDIRQNWIKYCQSFFKPYQSG
jgi:membrane protein implicated in regulation of membrane protease activity